MAYYRRREFKKREWGVDKTCACPDPIILEVVLEENDTTERLIKRFLKKYKKIKLMDELREHESFVSPSEEKRARKKRKLALIRKAQREREKKEKD